MINVPKGSPTYSRAGVWTNGYIQEQNPKKIMGPKKGLSEKLDDIC